MYRVMEENAHSDKRLGLREQPCTSAGVGDRLPHITVSSLNYNNN